MPVGVARAQAAWERRKAAARMRKLGFKLREMADALGISPEYARVLAIQADRRENRTPPIQRWFEEKADLEKLLRGRLTGGWPGTRWPRSTLVGEVIDWLGRR